MKKILSTPLLAGSKEGYLKECSHLSERDFLSVILDNINTLVVVLDRDGKVILMNHACIHLFGCEARDVMAEASYDESPLTDKVQALKTLLATLYVYRESNPYENEWVVGDSDVRTLAWEITELPDQQGVLKYICATGTDITNLKQTEKLVERERSLLRGLINSIPDPIFYKDLNGVYMGCNTALEVFRGCSTDEVVGCTDFDLYPQDLAEYFFKTDQEVVRDGHPLSYENWTRSKALERVLIETCKNPFYGPNGEVLGVIGIGRDITRHRMVEDDLRRAKSEIDQLIASLSSVLIVLNLETRIIQWNPMAEKLFGLSTDQALGHLLVETGIQWDWDAVFDGVRRCNTEKQPVFLEPMLFIRAGDGEGYLGISISPIYDGGNNTGGLLGFILLCGDITERRILENRLSQAQKLESIGRLAAGIAHEINTPIQYVGANIEFLQRGFTEIMRLQSLYALIWQAVQSGSLDPELISQVSSSVSDSDVQYLSMEVPQAIQQSLDGIQRISGIVRAMRRFSHPGVKEKIPVDINQAILDTLTVTHNEWSYIAEAETHLTEDLPQVVCFPGETNQVLLNLIVNAAQAIALVNQENGQEKGKISIQTQHIPGWVEIRISDTGPGIPREIQPRIFEPFFTTKPVGKGTGQGLAISYDVIVSKHAGTLTFETEMGLGTTFIIRFPDASQPA